MYNFRKILLVLFIFCAGCSNTSENQSQNTWQSESNEISQADTFNSALQELNIPESYRLEDIVIGVRTAPLTVVVYTSFSCGYCRDFWTDVFPKIYKKYVKTGKVKIIARNYLDDTATLEAAMLTRCAVGANPSENLEIAKKIYQKQNEWLKAKNPKQFLRNLFKKDFGYECDSWADSCLADVKLSAGMMLFQKDAFSKFGLKTVPSFLIIKNGKTIITHEGRISFNTFDLYLSEGAKIN